ncbi:glycan acetyltransferase [Sulfuricella denitrificans skB26]|uniref:Glycan acetyltransferase n=1 Tax=Sulfuricella denitrificans (strain DSM 22764 / NBRC 105220 / skB26) TaxID=1163617 RepID=S6ABI9_SULDS|nr:DapH/DapD/GlmU-related protein [Sulfuricella denitrificans]BAN36795.1 glycan acetyltransferase [Sulfuricella denitrificans skB26]
MRKITWQPIVVFIGLCLIVFALATATTSLLPGKLPLGDFRGIGMVAAWVAYVYAYAIAVYRLFLVAMPLPEGEIHEGSRAEFVYHVYVLFYLIFFNSIMRSGTPPIPFMRLLYLVLGARLGHNTYSSGLIYDPLFVQIGNNSVIGESALLVPHVIEGTRLAHHPIHIGNNVTVGAHAVVMSGVTIGDGAIVSVGAVVTKGTHIGAGEIWGGVPAKLLKRRESGAVA